MKDFKDLCLTLVAPILWGSTYILTATLIPINRPIFVALMRGLPIGLLLLLYYRKWPQGQWLLKSFVLGTLNIGAFFLLLFMAVYRLPGGIASVLGSVQPIFTLLFSWFFLKEKPTANAFIAIFMTLLGVSLLLSPKNMTLDPLGIIAALLGAIVMALGVVLTKYWGRPKDVSVMVFTAWQLFFGSLILIPFAYFLEGGFPPLTTTNWIGLLILGLFNTGLAYYLWFRGISKLTPTRVSFLGPINPLTAFLLGFIFLNQTIQAIQIVGVVCILSSVYFSQLRKVKVSS